MTPALTLMSQEQRLHLRALGSLWRRYGHVLRHRDEVVGGMQWKLTSGHEYLTRYRPDPMTGKKIARSLGRRSKETERQYDEFMRLREEVKSGLQTLAAEAEPIARAAKALRLARVPARQAEGLRNLWAAGLLDQAGPLALLGANAIVTYEVNTGVMTPSRILRDDGLVLYVRDGTDLSRSFGLRVSRAYAPKQVDVALEERRPGCLTLLSEDGSTLDLVSQLAVEEQLERRGLPDIVREVLARALTLPTVDAVTIARDASLVALTAVDPRAFCLMAPLLCENHEESLTTANERAMAVVEIVRELWREGFTPRMEAALERLHVPGVQGEPAPYLRLH